MPDILISPSPQREATSISKNNPMRVGIVLAMTLFMGSNLPARAMPVQPALSDGSQVIQVYNGCGLYGHRGPYGGCRPGGQRGGYDRFSCPPGFHVGPHGHFCFRN